MLLSTFALLILPILIQAKLCTLTTTTPQNCDVDQWHQELKLRILPGTTLNIDCFDRGRPVPGNGRWFYEGTKKCWLPERAVGVGCDCKFF